MSLSRGTVQSLAPERCAEIALASEQAKATDRDEDTLQARGEESWFLEAGASYVVRRSDAFSERLEAFDYGARPAKPYGASATAGVALTRSIALIANFGDLGSEWWRSDAESIRWRSFATTVGVRARYPLRGNWFAVFAEGSAGLGITKREFWHAEYTPNSYSSGDLEMRREFGLALRASAGFSVDFAPHFGLLVAGGYSYVPALRNEFDDKHNTGGPSVLGALRIHGVKG